MKTDYQRFRVYGRNGCMGEFYSYGFDIESSRNIFALMKKEKVKILYQMPITKILKAQAYRMQPAGFWLHCRVIPSMRYWGICDG